MNNAGQYVVADAFAEQRTDFVGVAALNTQLFQYVQIADLTCGYAVIHTSKSRSDDTLG